MKIQIFGGALLLIFSVYLGFSEVRRMNSRLATLKSLSALIAQFRRRIECFREPINSIYASLSDEHLKSIGFLSDLKSGGIAFAAEKCADLTPEEKISLKNFSEKLSEYYPEDAVKLCDLIYSEIYDSFLKAEREFAPRAKLYKTLPLLGGISVILLLA